MSERVELAREERLAVVTINHPPVNALNRQVMEELKSVFDRLAGETTVGAVIVTGAGENAFVAGVGIS